MAGISTPVKALSINAQWPGFASTKLKVRLGKVKSWSARRKTLVSKIKAAKPQILLLQELGQTEAAELFRDLGEAWHYQRNGLNVVGWREPEFEYVKTVEITLPRYQYPGRTYVEVWLKDKDGNRLRIGSTHLGVKYLGVAFTSRDSAYQAEQVQKIVSGVNDEDDDWPLVIGLDSNNKQSGTGSKQGAMWRIFGKYGFVWDRSGVDAVVWNYGVTIARVDRFELGDVSDHDGRVFHLTTKKK